MRTNYTKKPDFFIVGGPKCGTTSLSNYLNEHPEIFMASGEPRFFSIDVPNKNRRMNLGEYLSIFSNAEGVIRVGEKSASYLYSTKAAQEIFKFNPNSHIIIMIRNPIEMVYSLHGQLAYKSFREDILDFDKALDAEAERRQGAKLPKNNFHPGILLYSKIACYTEQIKRYYKYFQKDQVKIIVFDDFKNDTLITYENTLNFLNVDENFTPEIKVHNPAKTRRSLLFHRLTSSNSNVVKTANKFVPDILRPSLKSFHNVVEKINTIQGKRPQMSDYAKLKLKKYYENEVYQLSDLLQRDLTHWLK